MPTNLPRLTTSKPSGSKATVTLKSALKAPRPDAASPSLSSKVAGKRKGASQAAAIEADEESDAESNASGFSEVVEEDGLDGLMEDDEMDVDGKDDEGDEGSDDEVDTDDEIGAAKDGKKKSKKNTKKRKAPTSADTFGATLTSLLTTDPTPPSKRPRAQPSTAQQPILSLSAKAVPPSSNTLALEARAKRVIKAQKAEREDRARVRDVVEGWAPSGDAAQGGQERERSLRKVAQRGVVKLFNAILVASQTNPANPADLVNNERKSKKEKDNILGRGGKEERLTKEGFLDMIKAGGK